jgi:cytochrome b subunit of formate dehydrogenase
MFLTNCMPAVKNGGQNSIHHQRWTPIIYEWVYKNYRNNCVTHFYIIMTVTWLLATVMGDNKIDKANKCIQIAGGSDGHVPMKRYNAGCISQQCTSRASLEATECRYWVSACTVSPPRPTRSLILAANTKTLTKHKF